MADQQETLEYPDGNELFGSLQDTEASVAQALPETETAEQETTQERPRDESGKFVVKPKEEEAKTNPEPKPVQATKPEKADAMVPSWRFREQREEYEAKIAQLHKQYAQPKPEPVDFFADPDKSIDQRLAPLQNDIQSLAQRLTLQTSRALNISLHGKDTIAEAEKALGEAMANGNPDIPILKQKVQNSDDPVGVLLEWYQTEQFKKETGGDLNAYNAKRESELLANPEFLAKAVAAFKAQATGRPQTQTQIQIPRSLSNAASAAPANSRGGDGDDSPESIWAHATS